MATLGKIGGSWKQVMDKVEQNLWGRFVWKKWVMVFVTQSQDDTGPWPWLKSELFSSELVLHVISLCVSFHYFTNQISFSSLEKRSSCKHIFCLHCFCKETAVILLVVNPTETICHLRKEIVSWEIVVKNEKNWMCSVICSNEHSLQDECIVSIVSFLC